MSKSSLTAGQLSGNLNFSTAQKMIRRLLTQYRIKTALDEGRVINPDAHNEPEIIVAPYTREELSKKLGITLEELKKIESPDFHEDVASKVSLSLINLYCATKFADDEYKDKSSKKSG